MPKLKMAVVILSGQEVVAKVEPAVAEPVPESVESVAAAEMVEMPAFNFNGIQTNLVVTMQEMMEEKVEQAVPVAPWVPYMSSAM